MEAFKLLTISEKAWIEHPIYERALNRFHEYSARQMREVVLDEQALAGAPVKTKPKDTKPPANPLADKIVERIGAARDSIKVALESTVPAKATALEDRIALVEEENRELKSQLEKITARFAALEARLNGQLEAPKDSEIKNDAEDDDIDLFASDEEDDEAEKIKADRIAAYNEKKKAKEDKKGVVIAKSNILLDVKPWDDETDHYEMEKAVRKIEKDGLLWGTSKLVPVGYGIKKLQICCVVEDEKVGTDFLEEEITAIEDYVQSVDIVAFNKI